MSNRESYIPPSSQQGNHYGHLNGNTSSSTQNSTDNITGNANGSGSGALQQPQQPRLSFGRKEYDTPDEKVYYICGNCDAKSGFKANDTLRCLICGGATLYKQRVKQILQYQAV